MGDVVRHPAWIGGKHTYRDCPYELTTDPTTGKVHAIVQIPTPSAVRLECERDNAEEAEQHVKRLVDSVLD